MFGPDGRDAEGVAFEALRRKSPYDPPHHGPDLRREPTDAVHVVVVATQFLIDWRRARWRLPNGTSSAKDDE
jgi:hypothetical protein